MERQKASTDAIVNVPRQLVALQEDWNARHKAVQNEWHAKHKEGSNKLASVYAKLQDHFTALRGDLGALQKQMQSSQEEFFRGQHAQHAQHEKHHNSIVDIGRRHEDWMATVQHRIDELD